MPDHRVERVLMTGDTVGGVWTFTLDLARALDQYGIEVALATMGGHPSSHQQAEAASIPNLSLHSSPYKLEWMEDPWKDVEESGRWLLGLERHFAPDLIHLNTYGHGSLPWQAPILLTAHSCVLSWWAAVKRTPLPPGWNRYCCEVECSLKGADVITAPSHAMLRTLAENYGADLPPCKVIANGRDGSPYYSVEKEPFVLTAGRLWDEAKNVAAVTLAAPDLEWPVYAAGGTSNSDGHAIELRGCKSLGLLSAKELASWYSRASIYTLPARYEPFGLTAVEAGLSGCALVLGDIESLREVWGDAAVFVSPDDPGALRAALNDLIREPAKRTEMAGRARQTAQTFTAERMAREYSEAYSGLAAGRMACAS